MAETLARRDASTDDLHKRLKAAVEVETTNYLWVPADAITFVPPVLSTVYGDGRALFTISTINDRPAYWIVRGDSGWQVQDYHAPDDAPDFGDFTDDILTDLPERFIAAEIVREKLFRLTHEEIPYSVAVTVESFKERENGLIAISAVITVERDSQKGIVIGRKGELLKRIGTEARKEIEELLQAKVFLELFVRVRKNWTDNPSLLKEFGYQGHLSSPSWDAPMWEKAPSSTGSPDGRFPSSTTSPA